MLSFLQGFAIGLFLMCGPWFITGLFNPGLVLPDDRADRLNVFKRYLFVIPFLSFILGLTSLWGGFGPSLAGWLSGLGALFVWVPVEHRVRGFLNRRRLKKAQQQAQAELQANRAAHLKEQSTATLDLDDPAEQSDPLVKSLQRCKRQLKNVALDLAQPDRFYTRYITLQSLLAQRFESGELAMQRSQTLIQDVYGSVIHRLDRMVELQVQLNALDPAFIRRRLDDTTLVGTERQALQARWALVETSKQHLDKLTADNEAALTALDTTSIALMQLQTSDPGVPDADRVMAELDRFNQRVAQYEHATQSRKAQ
ncbi:cobyrinic acid a,c-diamide synthase [Nitrincola sp. MINF-07-Sa-05]|uniref:cobyrinic acid a,c-diamide synthase n=1 Tax=Nitrincola salilacus TaxID=3400273 RepID=UPI00391824F4